MVVARMAISKNIVYAVVYMAMVLFLQVCDAAVYKVGDKAGWTTIGNVDYKQWSATKNFEVGDVIIFEYLPQFHNVMQVTHAEYKSCNTTSPKATYTSGNDSITIKTKSHHYFFCGVPGHCQAGQKVDINVLRQTVKAPSPSELASPTVPATTVPVPSPNGGDALNPQKIKLGIVMVTLATYAVLHP